ncbi:MAG: hypothetical protein KA059_04900 [Elusimicrobiales bacterium]|nr:hypothetical protein [Elusimicrobiales bacterium]
MAKIKNFKIPVYYYDIQRRIKKSGINLNNLFGENTETNFKEFVSNIISQINPSAIYDNIELKQLEKVFGENYKEIFKAKDIDVISFSVITFGNEIEKKVLEINNTESVIVKSIIDVHFNTAVKFLMDAIAEEAKKENYILSEPEFLYINGEFKTDLPLKNILEQLESNKIMVEMFDDKVTPLYTQIFYNIWSSKKKR